MRELDLYSTIGTVISVCDSVNYLLEEEDDREERTGYLYMELNCLFEYFLNLRSVLLVFRQNL